MLETSEGNVLDDLLCTVMSILWTYHIFIDTNKQ